PKRRTGSSSSARSPPSRPACPLARRAARTVARSLRRSPRTSRGAGAPAPPRPPPPRRASRTRCRCPRTALLPSASTGACGSLAAGLRARACPCEDGVPAASRYHPSPEDRARAPLSASRTSPRRYYGDPLPDPVVLGVDPNNGTSGRDTSARAPVRPASPRQEPGQAHAHVARVARDEVEVLGRRRVEVGQEGLEVEVGAPPLGVEDVLEQHRQLEGTAAVAEAEIEDRVVREADRAIVLDAVALAEGAEAQVGGEAAPAGAGPRLGDQSRRLR